MMIMMMMNFITIYLLFSPVAFAFATLPGGRKHGSMTECRMANEDGIAVVGCGVLGTSLCKQLLSSPDFEGVQVTGITKTTNNHDSIQSNILDSLEKKNIGENFHLSTFDDIPKEKQFDHVVFCAPPSGFDDYPKAIQSVIDTLWSKSNHGSFVFTSSGGIYGPGNGETVNETTMIPTASSPRTKRLVEAELNTIAAGGCVLRLAGLYTLDRGAHNYWLEKGDGSIKGSKEGIINLLHYDDAAGSCMAALKIENKDDIRGKTFLISDASPTTRFGICESALKSKRYGGSTMPTFGSADQGGKGKVYDGHWSNDVLSWTPMYPSFDDFMINSQ